MNLHDPQLLAKQRGKATAVIAPGPDHVAILMAIRNGATWLPDQLASFTRQTHADWSLIVGDDRSTDDGPEIIHRFASERAERSVRVYPGPAKGFQANFLVLLGKVPPAAQFAAFSDQDDVWKPGKLERAIAALNKIPSGRPALYCSRTVIADGDLNVLGLSPRFARTPGFGNALVQSLAGGNTMVFNRPALELLQQCFDQNALPISHDWWAYQIVTGAGGTVIFDREPQVFYRQHGGNIVGTNSGLRAKFRRLEGLLNGEFARYSSRNIAALQRAKAALTPNNRRRLEVFVDLRHRGLWLRLYRSWQARLSRQTLAGTLALWGAIILKKV